MEVNVEQQAYPLYLHSKNFQCPLYGKLDCPPDLFFRSREEQNVLYLPGIEPRFVCIQLVT